jgi:hypothetical protein
MMTSASVPKWVASTVTWAARPGSGDTPGASRLTQSAVERANKKRSKSATGY